MVNSEPSQPNRTCRKNTSASGTTHSSSSSTVQYRSPDGSLTANARTPSPVLVLDTDNYYQQQEQQHSLKGVLAWSQPEVTRIIAQTEEGNAASAGVLRHAGFREDGVADGLRNFSLDRP